MVAGIVNMSFAGVMAQMTYFYFVRSTHHPGYNLIIHTLKRGQNGALAGMFPRLTFATNGRLTMATEPRHTPGPLRMRFRTQPFAGFYFYDADDNLVAATVTNKVNAERLIACWNACQGINPQAVPDLLDVVKRIVSWIGDDCDCKNGNPATCVKCLARAALAKTERKKT